MEVHMDPKEILKQPYARILTPDPDGRVTAEIMEFPGCVAFGDNATSALANLEEVAAEWIAAAVEQGQNIPEPMDSSDFSGKLVLRMSSGLHRRAALCAEREGVSLNSFIVTSLAEAVGERARPNVVHFAPFAAFGTNMVVVPGPTVSVTNPHQGLAVEWKQQLSAAFGTQVIHPMGLAMERFHARG
jgi:antitoxin HicB